MREIRPSGSEGGARSIPCPYPYPPRLTASSSHLPQLEMAFPVDVVGGGYDITRPSAPEALTSWLGQIWDERRIGQ